MVLGGTTRLITLTGVAGIGKTRLALAVAEAAAGRGRRTWWVPLSDLGESTYVLDAVAGALGLSEVTVEAIGTRLGASRRCSSWTTSSSSMASVTCLPIFFGAFPR